MFQIHTALQTQYVTIIISIELSVVIHFEHKVAITISRRSQLGCGKYTLKKKKKSVILYLSAGY